MKSRSNKIIPKRSPRLLAKALLLLCVASQSLAAPVHQNSNPANTDQASSVVAECPAHQDATAEVGNPESCECSGGACCKARLNRLPALISTEFESIPAECRHIRLTESTAQIKYSLFISSTRSRAPPFTPTV